MMTDGQYVTSGQGKSDLSAMAFWDRLNVPILGTRHTLNTARTERSSGPDLQPLPPFREVITEEPEPIMGFEIVKAVGRLVLGKAPGPDGLPALFSKKLTVMKPVLEVVLNRMLETGRIPKSPTQIHVVLLLKPGKVPQKAKSRRPISLIRPIMRTMGSVLFHSMLSEVESHLDPSQYA